MRIGIFTDTYPPDINGVATACELLARELKKRGHSVYVVTTNRPKARRISIEDDLIRIPGIEIKKIYSYRMTGPFSIRVYNLLKKLELDLVHVHTEYGIGMFGRLVARFRHVPLIYTYHSLYEDFTYLLSGGRKLADHTLKAAVSSLSRNLSSRPTEIIVPTEKTAQALKRYRVKRKVHVIPDGVDVSEFSPAKKTLEAGREIRDSLGLEDCKVLSVVGRIGQEKGLDFLLRCLRYYIDTYRDESIRLLIVGSGPYLKELKKKVSSLWLERYVIFIGAVPHVEVPSYYAASDVLLSGSKSETQGLTIIEAMASRCLVLCRDDPSFYGAITEGETGFYFKDSESFASNLRRIFELKDTDIERILDQAERRVRERYSPSRCTEEVEDVYRQAIDKYRERRDTRRKGHKERD